MLMEIVMPSKETYWRNPEKYRAKTNAYREANPGWHKDSNRDWARKKRARVGKEGLAAYHLARKKADPIGYLLRHAETRAKKLGIPFDLGREDLVMPDVCPVLGLPFEWGVGQMGWRNMRSPSLDKIKPQLGYVKGNVRIISNRANHLKSNGTISEFEAVLAYMKREGCNEDLSEQGQPKRTDPIATAQLTLGW